MGYFWLEQRREYRIARAKNCSSWQVVVFLIFPMYVRFYFILAGDIRRHYAYGFL
jgi:hypothetical protein